VTFIYISFFYKNSKLHTYESIIYIFRLLYDEKSNIQLSAIDNDKMTCQNISTKVSFKIAIRKKNVYIDIG